MGEHAAAGKRIAISSVPNLRDLGGWPVQGGAVRRGQLFRSSELAGLQDADMGAFDSLGIGTIFDLRTQVERTAQPDRALPGTSHVVADVLEDSADAAPAQLLEILSDPKAANTMLGGGRAVEMFTQGYRDFVSLPSARTAYSAMYSAFADEMRRPALFHCTGGKDRTGWAAAALLTLLGVSDSDVMKEYLLTNDQLLPSMQPLLDRFEAAGGDPELLLPVIGVREEYLEAALAEMSSNFGTIDRYFEHGLGLGTSTVSALKMALIDRK